jgi:hypothetical protein
VKQEASEVLHEHLLHGRESSASGRGARQYSYWHGMFAAFQSNINDNDKALPAITQFSHP